MLTITVPAQEFYDEDKNLFIDTPPVTFSLEHSLLSISKWESKWKKSYLSRNDKTNEEMLDYIRCMTITPNIDPAVYTRLSADNIRKIQDYINDPMTATTFKQTQIQRHSNDIVTAELVYYWMITAGIPMECQKWHINRLLALIRVCEIKNAPAKKMKKKDILSQNAAVNAKRRAAMHSLG